MVNFQEFLVMTEQEAIQFATAALFKPGCHPGNRAIRAWRSDPISVSNPRPGWVVALPLDVPEEFEPNVAFVEVFEPDGEVNIPAIL